jgi:hypothetical protein
MFYSLDENILDHQQDYNRLLDGQKHGEDCRGRQSAIEFIRQRMEIRKNGLRISAIDEADSGRYK